MVTASLARGSTVAACPPTLDAVYRHWVEGRPLPAKPIVLSFDDGIGGLARKLGRR